MRWRVRLAAVDDKDLWAHRVERCERRRSGDGWLRKNIEYLRQNFPLVDKGLVKRMA